MPISTAAALVVDSPDLTVDGPELAPPAQLSLHLTPLSSVSIRPFRAELTIEEQSLFVVNSFKGDWFEREVITTHPKTGEHVVSRVLVGKEDPKDRRGVGVLQQRHQDALYRLYEMWDRQGYPAATFRDPREKRTVELGVLHATRYELATAFFPGDDSASAYQRTRELIRDMRTIPILVQNVNTWEGWVPSRSFFLLGDYTSWSRKAGEDNQYRIMFSEFITAAFKARYHRTLLGQPYDGLNNGPRGRRSEIARLMYPYLDMQLAKKPRFEAPLKALAERFALRAWPQRSRRKEQFGAALAVLQGRQILEGKFKLALELLAVPDDFILRAERVPL